MGKTEATTLLTDWEKLPKSKRWVTRIIGHPEIKVKVERRSSSVYKKKWAIYLYDPNIYRPEPRFQGKEKVIPIQTEFALNRIEAMQIAIKMIIDHFNEVIEQRFRQW